MFDPERQREQRERYDAEVTARLCVACQAGAKARKRFEGQSNADGDGLHWVFEPDG